MRIFFFIVSFVLALLVALFFQGKKKEVITVVGSKALSEVTKSIAKEVYSQANIVVNVDETNSEDALQKLIAGTCDLAMTSRRIRADEKVRIKQMHKEVQEVMIAIDGMVFIVHQNNKHIKVISPEQLANVFGGKITNWKELGGDDEKIKIVINQEDGFFDLFKEYIMNQKPITVSVMHMPNAEAIVQTVRELPGGIGFVPNSFTDTTVNKLAIVKEGVVREPTKANISTKFYPYSFPFYYYYLVDNSIKVQPMIDVVKSQIGTVIVEKAGYLLPQKKY